MFILGILLHETGHFLGGLISGYHFLHIEILGFTLEKINGSFRHGYYKKSPVGQCLMYHEDINKNGLLLIIGGILMNLLVSMMSIIAFIVMESIIVRLLFLTAGMVNLSLALMNIFGSSSSDGSTVMEILQDSSKMQQYNKLLLISKYLREGKSYTDMPGVWFGDSCGLMCIECGGQIGSHIKRNGNSEKKTLWSRQAYDVSKNKSVNRIKREGNISSLGDEFDFHRRRYYMECGNMEWNAGQAGFPLGDLVEEMLKKIEATKQKDEAVIDSMFMEIVNRGIKSMYAGEYLSAARCFKKASRKIADGRIRKDT